MWISSAAAWTLLLSNTLAMPGAGASTHAVRPPPEPPPVLNDQQLAARRAQGQLPPRPTTHRGLGAMVTAGAAGALAWGATVMQIRVVDGCAADIRSEVVPNSAIGCLLRQGDNLALRGSTAVKIVSNVATWGLAPVSGALRADHDAVRTVWDGARRRNPTFWMGTGIGLSVAAMLGSAASLVTFGGACGGGDCTNELRAHFFAQQVSQSVLSAGLGMFWYGMTYRRELQRYDAEARRVRLATLRLAPQVGLGYAGAGVSARF